MRIGLLTDTHLPSTIRELWPEVRAAFTGVDLILHSGDIVTPGVLDWLEDIAPTLAAKGVLFPTSFRGELAQYVDLNCIGLVGDYDVASVHFSWRAIRSKLPLPH